MKKSSANTYFNTIKSRKLAEESIKAQLQTDIQSTRSRAWAANRDTQHEIDEVRRTLARLKLERNRFKQEGSSLSPQSYPRAETTHTQYPSFGPSSYVQPAPRATLRDLGDEEDGLSRYRRLSYAEQYPARAIKPGSSTNAKRQADVDQILQSRRTSTVDYSKLSEQIQARRTSEVSPDSQKLNPKIEARFTKDRDAFALDYRKKLLKYSRDERMQKVLQPGGVRYALPDVKYADRLQQSPDAYRRRLSSIRPTGRSQYRTAIPTIEYTPNRDQDEVSDRSSSTSESSVDQGAFKTHRPKMSFRRDIAIFSQEMEMINSAERTPVPYCIDEASLAEDTPVNDVTTTLGEHGGGKKPQELGKQNIRQLLGIRAEMKNIESGKDTDQYFTMSPYNALQSKYLRLHPRQVRYLEERCRAEGYEPPPHIHKRFTAEEERLRRKSSVKVQAIDTRAIQHGVHKVENSSSGSSGEDEEEDEFGIEAYLSSNRRI